MEPVAALPRPIGSSPRPGAHKPLQRVLPSKVSHQASELSAAHPLLFTQSAGGIPVARTSASVTTSDASNPDSCYSSCSEESHTPLSRESSDSATQELFEPELDEKLVEFATKLGFSRTSLRIVLDKLGPGAQQNNVLAELISLGKASQADCKQRAQSLSAQFEQQLNADKTPPKLRPIVIDGSNIAMTHGHKEVFSCLGIRECVNFFTARGHTDIIVFVPQFRRESPRPDCPITDQHILLDLESEKRLIWTPARRVGGRRIVCHDDRYILKTADEKEAVVVSNDEYRDLVKENPQYRQMVEQRLLMYSFVDGKFMPPDDPLGRRGPTLDQFLSFGPSATTAQLCPYAKKCTYGNKCKYYHPERKNGQRQSATDRLTGGRRKQNLGERPSMIYENSNSRSHRPGVLQSPALCNLNNRNVVGRTQSLNLPQQNPATMRNNVPFGYGNPFAATHTPQPVPSNLNCASLWSALHPQHTTLNRNFSNPLRNNYDLGGPQSLIMDTDPLDGSRSTSMSDFSFMPSSSGPFTSASLLPPTTSTAPTPIWGEGLFPMSTQSVFGNNAQRQSPGPAGDDERLRLQYHLCQLFPEASVMAVCSAHPEEMDPMRLATRIIKYQEGFES